MTFEDAFEAMLHTRANKRRSADSVDFEVHWERNLMRLVNDVNARRFRPSAYTFIRFYPKPREVFACNFALRVLHHYIDIRLRPLLDEELTTRTYNNRQGFGPDAAINQLIEDAYRVSEGYTKDAWFIQWDLEGYFPNASQDVVFEQIADMMKRRYRGDDWDDLYYMVQVSVFAYPTEHCVRKSPLWMWPAYIERKKSLFSKPPGTGASIGHLIWQNGMNLYAASVDRMILHLWQLLFVRYVDDGASVTNNKEAFLAQLPLIRAEYAKLGCTMHPRKFYCQHVTKGIKFIGAHIKKGRVYLDNRVIRRAHTAVRAYNLKPSPRLAESFLSSVNSYLGMMKTRNEHNNAMRLVHMVDKKWLRYVHFNASRQCFQANEGYGHLEQLGKKYHLRLKERCKQKT